MRAITPIVSTIILLLIAIALAGTAYVYITGITGPLTSKDFFVVIGSESCIATTRVKLMLVNTGSSHQNLENSDIVISTIDGNEATPQPFSIAPGGSEEITIKCSTRTCPLGSHTLKIGTTAGIKSVYLICVQGPCPAEEEMAQMRDPCNFESGYQCCKSDGSTGMFCDRGLWDAVPCPSGECFSGPEERCDME